MTKLVLGSLIAAAMVCSTIAGCATAPADVLPTTRPAMSWSHFDDLDVNARWLVEARKRFADPIVFSCHGRDLAGRWVSTPDAPRPWIDVESLAITLSNLYPDRSIVLVCCNPEGRDLDVPNVWYAHSSVWCVPDDQSTPVFGHETKRGEGYVGSIWEFVTQGKR